MDLPTSMTESWPGNTLEGLENKVYNYPEFDSYLLRTCYNLRKKNLRNFTVEDIRILTGQNIGLKHLMPMAIDVLRENIFAEGDFYQGDLLKSVLTADKTYWGDHYPEWKVVKELFESKRNELKGYDISNTIKKGWFESYREFSQIHE